MVGTARMDGLDVTLQWYLLDSPCRRSPAGPHGACARHAAPSGRHIRAEVSTKGCGFDVQLVAAIDHWVMAVLVAEVPADADMALPQLPDSSGGGGGGWLNSIFAGSPSWVAPTVSTAALILGIWLVVSQLRASAKGKGTAAVATSARAPRETGREEIAPVDADGLRSLQQELDQLIQDLDARSSRLEDLIARAEEKIGVLQQAVASPARELVESKPRQRPMIAEPLISDPVHQQVYQLSDAGYSPVDIARRLQQPTGQVELILALRAR